MDILRNRNIRRASAAACVAAIVGAGLAGCSGNAAPAYNGKLIATCSKNNPEKFSSNDVEDTGNYGVTIVGKGGSERNVTLFSIIAKDKLTLAESKNVSGGSPDYQQLQFAAYITAPDGSTNAGTTDDISWQVVYKLQKGFRGLSGQLPNWVDTGYAGTCPASSDSIYQQQ